MARQNLIPGCRAFLHGGDYNPDQWLRYPEILQQDARLMKLSGCNTFSVGIFAWTALEPREGNYQFDWLDETLDRLHADGHRVILATPSGAKPPWLAKKNPEVCRVNKAGLREPYGQRHNHCWTSPVYRQKVAEINALLAERYAKHPSVGMWHISNEFSGDCYCETCLAKWFSWLESRYTTLDALNDAWWTGFWSHGYSDWTEVDPRDECLDGLQVDWMRFRTRQVVDFYCFEREVIRRFSDLPCTTNLMGLLFDLDYSALAREVDVIADDQYPCYSPEAPNLLSSAQYTSFKDDVHRGFKRDRPWMLMESCPESPQWTGTMRLKPDGLHFCEMLQAIGHGAEGTCYFQWRKGMGGMEKHHGAVVDHAGHEGTRAFRMVSRYSEMLRKLDQVIGSVNQAHVAMVYDWESRWGLAHSMGPNLHEGGYHRTLQAHHRALSELTIPVDVLTSPEGFENYRLLVMPRMWMVSPEFAQRLATYVEHGGFVIADCMTGCVDLHNRCHLGGFPGNLLGDLFGVWAEELDFLNDGAVRRAKLDPGNSWDMDGEFEYSHVAAVTHLDTAKVLATHRDGIPSGSSALSYRRFGAGTAIYLSCEPNDDFLVRFYARVAERLGLDRLLRGKAPKGVLVQRRQSGDRSFLFLQNFSSLEQDMVLSASHARSLLTGEELPGRIRMAPMSVDVLTY